MILGSGLLTASGKTRLTLYTTKSGTFNPTIVASDTSGIVWDFGDGSATYTGGTPSHSYADGTQKTVRITFDDPTLVTELNFPSMSMVGEWPLSSLAKFTSLNVFTAYLNAGLNVSGLLADIPSSIVNFRIYNTASTLTGSLSNAPAGILYLYLFSSFCNINGGTTPLIAVAINNIRVESTSTTQANIDDILSRLYADRASFNFATPALNVGGTNPNPTGTYADATPPTTGLEYAYKLVNDPDAEGFKKWAITY